MEDAKKLFTLETFLSMTNQERGERAEFIGGQIVQKSLPSGKHGKLEMRLGFQIASKFLRKSRDDGTGGWWIQTETSVLHPGVREIHTHDLVGWRRDRVSEEPLDYPVRERPDWVCEIAVSTLRKDIRDTRAALDAEDVPFYWVLDAANEQLLIFERVDGHLVQTRNLFREDGMQRIPPFEVVEFSMPLLLGDDPE